MARDVSLVFFWRGGGSCCCKKQRNQRAPSLILPPLSAKGLGNTSWVLVGTGWAEYTMCVLQSKWPKLSFSPKARQKNLNRKSCCVTPSVTVSARMESIWNSFESFCVLVAVCYFPPSNPRPSYRQIERIRLFILHMKKWRQKWFTLKMVRERVCLGQKTDKVAYGLAWQESNHCSCACHRPSFILSGTPLPRQLYSCWGPAPGLLTVLPVKCHVTRWSRSADGQASRGLNAYLCPCFTRSWGGGRVQIRCKHTLTLYFFCQTSFRLTFKNFSQSGLTSPCSAVFKTTPSAMS